MNAGYPPNFKPNEFYCKCGKCLGAPPNAYATRHLAWALQKIRNAAGVPLKINSAYRCQEHNESVGVRRTPSTLLALLPISNHWAAQQKNCMKLLNRL